jgi:hypothetical protein
MKKLVVRKSVFAVALSAGVILSGISRAESYDDYNAGFKKDLSKVDVALKGANPANTADSLNAAASSELTQIGDEVLTGAKKELFQEEQKLQNWNKKLKKVNAMGPAMDAFIKKAVTDRTVKLDEAQGLASQLSSSGAFINPSDFDVSSLANSCQNGVDFSPLLQIAQTFGSDKVDYLRRKAQTLLEEKTDEAKNLERKKILELISNLKELNAKNEELDAQTLQPEELEKLDSLDSIESRLAKLKRKNPEAKSQVKKAESDLVGKFQAFTEQLFQIRDNDSRVQQLGDEFARGIEQQQQMMMMVAQQSTSQLLQNCVQETDGIFQEIDNTRRTLINRVGSRVAALDAQAQEQRANSMGFFRGDYTTSCPDIATNLQGTIGGFFNTDLPNRLRAVRSTKNPSKMLVEAVGVMDAVRNLQAQIGPALQPLMEGCDTASKIRASLRQRTQSTTNNGTANNGSLNNGLNASTVPTVPRNSGTSFGPTAPFNPNHTIRR